MAEQTTTTKPRKKRATQKKVATKKTVRRRKLTTEENAEVKAAVAKFTLRNAGNGKYSTDVTDVMPPAMIMAIQELGVSGPDGYFLGAMAAKMVNVLSPIEQEHLSNLLTPLIDKLHKSHL